LLKRQDFSITDGDIHSLIGIEIIAKGLWCVDSTRITKVYMIRHLQQKYQPIRCTYREASSGRVR